MANHPLPSAGYLHECFIYDPERGTLTWRKTRPPEHFSSVRHLRKWTTVQAGKNAYVDMPRAKGDMTYKRTYIDGRYYMSHRIIYKMMTFDDPPNEIDHINRHPDDNRWINLRSATRQQNVWNSPAGKPRHKDNTHHLPTGVYPIRNKYQAFYRAKYLGLFDTIEDAGKARMAYARVQRGEFYYEGRPSVAGKDWWTHWDG